MYSYTNEKGVDMTLYVRKKELNDKNLSLCADNCDYVDYDNQTKKVLCQCEPQYNSSLITLEKIINKEKLINNFKDLKKTMNVEVIKCYKKLLSTDGLKNNIGSHILLSILFIFFVGLMAFICKGFNTLKGKIQMVVKSSAKIK